MNDNPSSFDQLARRLQQGDADAAGELYRRFAGRLVALARQKLPAKLRTKLDPEDVVQSAMGSFFWRLQDGQFELADWHALWSLLVLITLRKCGHKIEYYLAACRDLRRELQLADSESSEAAPSNPAAWHALAREPDPAELAEIFDVTETLMKRLNRKQRRIVMLRLQGLSTDEIAQQLGKSRRSVQLVLETAREVLLSLFREAESEQ